jgi:uncharacterized protein with NRDE domain
LCGRDLAAGGTWCGLHATSGHFAVLTNVFEPCAVPMTNNLTSRGKLVEMFIKGHFDLNSPSLLPNWKDFMGFNLLFGNVTNFIDEVNKPRTPTDDEEPSLYFISNRSFTSPAQPQEPFITPIREGVHCVSNSYLNDEEWPKVQYLRNEMEKVVQSEVNRNASAQELCEQLAQLLTARPMFPPEQVQRYLIDETIEFCKSVQESGSDVIVSENSGTTLQLDEMVAEVMDSCQNIFVEYGETGKEVKFKTKSQTIMMLHRSGKVHYFYRNTDQVVVPVPILPNTEEMKQVSSTGWREFVVQY